MKLVVSCEHADREIPREFRERFSRAEGVLQSHRGYDPGALDLFNVLKDLADFHVFHPISRLLVEVNRSEGHPQLFSEFMEPLSGAERKSVLDSYYFPYRDQLENRIREYLTNGESVLHLSIHSFTPALHGEVRNADIGLLFDPSRNLELTTCNRFQDLLRTQDDLLRIRFNYPYLGTSDGLTTHLRSCFPSHYAGIEIEINQSFVKDNRMATVIKELMRRAVHTLIKNPTDR